MAAVARVVCQCVQGPSARQKAAADHGYHPGCLHLLWGHSTEIPAAGDAEEAQSLKWHAVASQHVGRGISAGCWAEDERKSGG